MRRLLLLASIVLLAMGVATARSPEAGAPVKLPGLKAAAEVARDPFGIAHVRANNEHDLFLLQGYVHAQDRLFQMDFSRRLASGTLAELLGPAALASDVQFRTLGLRRGAERSLAAASPRARAAFEAYAQGVNLFVAEHPLPPEYGALERTRFEPWSALDCVVVGKLIAFGLSFDLSDIENTITLLTYQQAGAIAGFDGTALFFEDLFRAAPFDPAATIPDASRPPAAKRRRGATLAPIRASGGSVRRLAEAAAEIDPRTVEMGRDYLERVRAIPYLRSALDRDAQPGSNEWAVSGKNTVSGYPLLANDPHLALDFPSTFYPMHLRSPSLNVMGSGFPGAAFVIVGHNRFISWGATNHRMDVVDVYQEQIAPDATSPSGLSIVHLGQLEPIIPIPEIFRANQPGNGVPDDVIVIPPGGEIPPATLVVPRRNNGPIIDLDPETGVALSVQFTGFGPTRELEAALAWNDATGIEDFVRGLQLFDVGAQHWAYSDIDGNIAYFSSAEMPVREDLQAGTVNGLPPFFIRNGTGGNEWMPVQNPQPEQATPFEILPYSEMPQIVNPAAGWFVNANNDPVGNLLDNDALNLPRPGGGIFYLGRSGYERGFRAGRITQMIRDKLAGGGKISFRDMQEMQADTVLPDAPVFVPFILDAMENARAQGAHPVLAPLGDDPAIAAAVKFLAEWDFTSPTGISEGYDASDDRGSLSEPSNREIASSVAATVFSMWRSRFVANTIDAVLSVGGLPRPGSQQTVSALRHLLDNFDTNAGVGASGLSFFNVPGVDDPAARRDILILLSLSEALEILAGESFAPAFGMSTTLSDYRWGKLHRIVFSHPLGPPFSVPPAGGAFPPPLEGLAGIPTDGGLRSVDASHHALRAAGVDDFMFAAGAVNRYVSEAGRNGFRVESIWPGGTSGVVGTPDYANMLPLWLSNDTVPLLSTRNELRGNRTSVIKFVPEKGRGRRTADVESVEAAGRDARGTRLH